MEEYISLPFYVMKIIIYFRAMKECYIFSLFHAMTIIIYSVSQNIFDRV